MKVLMFSITFAVFFLVVSVSSEIIVKRGYDGRIYVTNNPSVSGIRSSGSSVSSAVSSYSPKQVPYLYSNKISKLSRKYMLREDLIIAVARAESGFNPFARSKKGAVGIMQLMKNTADQYGVTNRYNVDQNLDAGVRHLKYLYKKYNKNLRIVLAAYNAGEEAVRKYKGVPPYRETRDYIRKVKKFMGLSYGVSISSSNRTKIFKYKTIEGKIVLSDSPPPSTAQKIEVIY